ncbi:MAG: ATP-binding protein [Desulfurococcales archaeon]|nr:ATP-binding protein [Desulfurococcales archaeon]
MGIEKRKYWAGGWEPFEEIVEGRIRSDSFTVELWTVHRGCPSGGWECIDERYKDPAKFFDRTYFSGGFSDVLAGAVRRLVEGGGDAVYLLHTGFGGGKSHTLVAIYHLARSPDRSLDSIKLRRFLEERGLRLPQDLRAAVSVFDGAALDPISLRRRYGAPNPWVFMLKELAADAGDEGLVREVEEYRDAVPGHDALSRIFSAIEARGFRPVVLIDELAVYLRNLASMNRESEAGALRVFIHNLAVAASNTRHTLVVIATPQQYEAESAAIESLLSDVQRVAATTSIVGPSDAAEVLKSALIKAVDSTAAEEAAKRYMKEYLSRPERYPGEVLKEDYRDEMRRSYPFHPFLVRELYENVAQTKGFQGTRDILRIAAWTLHFRTRSPEPGTTRDFILLGDVDVTKSEIRDLLKVDNEPLKKLLESVSYDIEVVKELDEERVRKGLGRVASMAYSAILLRSISGRYMKESEVMAAAATPLRAIGVDLVSSVLELLARETAHLHKKTLDTGETAYMVKAKANIYMLVNRRAVELLNARRSVVREALKGRLERLASSPEVKSVVWPRHPGEVEDTPRLKLVLLDPEFEDVKSGDKERLKGLMARFTIYSQKGDSEFRRHRNTLVFLAPSMEAYRRALQDLALLMAIDEVEDESDRFGVQREDLEELASERRKLERRLEEELQHLYVNVYYPIAGSTSGGFVDFAVETLSPSTIRRGRLWHAVAEALEAAGKLARQGLTPSYVRRVVEELNSNLGRPVSLDDVLESLTGDVGKPMVLRAREYVAEALARLVEDGLLAAVDASGENAVCMGRVRRVEDYFFVPCASKEAANHCYIVKEDDGKAVCRPKPPKDCIKPEWDEASRSWVCKEVRAGEHSLEKSIQQAAAPTPLTPRRPDRVKVTLDEEVQLPKLRERIEGVVGDPRRARVVDAYVEVSVKLRAEKARPLTNLLALTVEEVYRRASLSYKVEARLTLNLGHGSLRGFVDLKFMDVERMKAIAPGLAQLLASSAREVEEIIQLIVEYKGGEAITLADIIEAFTGRLRLERSQDVAIKKFEALVQPEEAKEPRETFSSPSTTTQ